MAKDYGQRQQIPAQTAGDASRLTGEGGFPLHGLWLRTHVFPLHHRGPRLIFTAMLKWLKFFIAILLLPVCASLAMALGAVLQASGGADITWIPFLAGVACWCVIYFTLPKPMWIYVFGHELTHALWAWLFGASIKRMKVTSAGGHVVVSKTNFLITLAPYFFPLYAVIVIAIFASGHWIWGWSRFLVYFHLLVGAAYAFHVTLTFQILQTQQSDITSQGYLFSAVIIFLGNAGILLFGIPLLAQSIPMTKAVHFWFRDTIAVLLWLQKLA